MKFDRNILICLALIGEFALYKYNNYCSRFLQIVIINVLMLITTRLINYTLQLTS